MKSPPVSEAAAHLEGLAELAGRVAREMAGEIAEIAELVVRALVGGGKLMFCGNGGSAADAQHLAAEYVVRFRRSRLPFSAIALTTDTSVLTAAANDFGFEHVFARQLRALGRPGDVLFLHSTSGESRNLLEAARAAAAAQIHTVAMLARGGGALRELVDRALVVPTDSVAHAQEIHLAVGHAICEIVESRLATEPGGGY
ncbi:MAG: SIS domain-containing protein [bacterium]|jgi:D-sedoheptulose 7-phosphate isomerase|nr:MAG: phosphoheptose isomerase [bacterium]